MDGFILNLQTFKTQMCPNKIPHNLKHCTFFHNPKDKRRQTNFYTYSAETCPHIDSGVCPYGDICKYSHNKVEELYHPDRYKNKFCSNYPNNVLKCEYGRFCSFAHFDQEILIDLLHLQEKNEPFYLFKYKTIYCPFTTNHDRGQCVYAHNVQDFRRNPKKFNYGPEACPNWNTSDSISTYPQGGCLNLYNCTKCHGWKEQEYHPLNYKTRKCTNGKNCRRKECAFFHGTYDRRILNRNRSDSLEEGGAKDLKNSEASSAGLKKSVPSDMVITIPSHLVEKGDDSSPQINFAAMFNGGSENIKGQIFKGLGPAMASQNKAVMQQQNNQNQYLQGNQGSNNTSRGSGQWSTPESFGVKPSEAKRADRPPALEYASFPHLTSTSTLTTANISQSISSASNDNIYDSSFDHFSEGSRMTANYQSTSSSTRRHGGNPTSLSTPEGETMPSSKNDIFCERIDSQGSEEQGIQTSSTEKQRPQHIVPCFDEILKNHSEHPHSATLHSTS